MIRSSIRSGTSFILGILFIWDWRVSNFENNPKELFYWSPMKVGASKPVVISERRQKSIFAHPICRLLQSCRVEKTAPMNCFCVHQELLFHVNITTPFFTTSICRSRLWQERIRISQRRRGLFFAGSDKNATPLKPTHYWRYAHPSSLVLRFA